MGSAIWLMFKILLLRIVLELLGLICSCGRYMAVNLKGCCAQAKHEKRELQNMKATRCHIPTVRLASFI